MAGAHPGEALRPGGEVVEPPEEEPLRIPVEAPPHAPPPPLPRAAPGPPPLRPGALAPRQV